MRHALIACLLAVSGTEMACAEPLKAALSVTVAFEDASGRALTMIPPGEPFTIRARIANLAGTDPPAGLSLSGWLRPVSSRNLDCADAARAYRATNGLPTNAIDLNGTVIAVLSEDHGVTLADPDLNLASANLIAATTLGSAPAAMVADPAQRRFLVALPDEGVVKAIPALGGTTSTLAEGLDRPMAIIPGPKGSFWVQQARELRLIGGAGTRLAASRVHASETAPVLAAWGQGLIEVVRLDGEPLLSLAEPRGLRDALPLAEEGVFSGLVVLRGDHLDLHYADAPDSPIAIPLASTPDKLAASPDGRWLLAWSQTEGVVEIVDLVHGKVAQAVVAQPGISAVSFGRNSAYLMLSDHSKLAAIDLASVQAGRLARLREIALGNPTSARETESLLLPLPGDGGLMAIHPDTSTGFFIHDNPATGDAPPMTAVSLRGGIPLAAAALDRGFREIVTGIFETVAVVPDATPFELVATTGIGSLSFCLPLPGAASDLAKAGPGQISILPEDRGFRLSLTTTDGHPARVEGAVTFTALMTGWRRSVTFRTGEDGLTTQSYVLPAVGPVSVSVAAASGLEFAPAVTGGRP